MGKFVVKQTNTGFKFDLVAGNGEVIATSEVYAAEASCLNGIESVIKCSAAAEVEDQTVETVEAKKHPKFEVYADKAGEFRFRLKARNGEIIATGEGYKARKSCLNGIESVKANCVGGVEDQTVEPVVAVKHPKFEIYNDKAGEFRFRLKAKNGEIIAVSEGYASKDSCENGIESVKKNAPDAETVTE